MENEYKTLLAIQQNGDLNPVQRTRLEELQRSYGSGSGIPGVMSADDILKKAVSAYTALVPKPPTPYDQVNPFSFDEALARQASTAEYTPYYGEQLTDYVSNIQKTKSRSTEDLKSTLSFLSATKDYFVGNERKLLDRAIDTTNKGYAGRGLFFSGAREKDIKQMQTDTEQGVSEYLRGYQYKTDTANLDVNRQMSDLETQQKQYTRDIGRQKDYAIETGVSQRKQEATSDYETGRSKYYEDWYYNNYPA